MKTYLVLLTAYRTIIVRAENKEGAEDVAGEIIGALDGDWEIEDWKCEQELTDDFNIGNSIRHGAEDLREETESFWKEED